MWVKMNSENQNIFMLKNINCITIVITLEGIEKIKTEKKKKNEANQCEEYFFHQGCKKTATNSVMAFRFDRHLTSYDYLIVTFHCYFSPPICPF